MILLRPCDKRYPLTQLFGENPQNYPNPPKGHQGIDFGLPEGSKVVAAHAGTVAYAGLDPETGRNPKYGYGIYVKLLGDNNVTTIYGHFTQTLVKVGDVVSAGFPIGLSGNTGNSTAPHLHFELRTGANSTNPIDPLPYVVDSIDQTQSLFRVTITPDGDGLRVRTSPRTGGVVRNLRPGDMVDIIGLAAGDVWLTTTDGNFIKFDPSWMKISHA